MHILSNKYLYPFIAFILYALGANVHSFWNDEFITLNISNSNFLSIVPKILNGVETHPPLYPIIAKVFFYFFGSSFMAIRIFTSLIGAILIFVSVDFAKKYLSNKENQYYKVLLLISPLLLYFAHEYRAYALFSTFLILWLKDFDTFLTSKNKKLCFRWAFWASCAFYTHTHAVLFIAPVVLLSLRRIIKDNKLYLLLLNTGIILIVCIPWVALIYKYKIQNINDSPLGYAKEVNLKTLAYTFYSFLFGYSFGPSKIFLHHHRNIKIILENFPMAMTSSLFFIILFSKALFSQVRKKSIFIPSHVVAYLLLPIGTGFLLSCLTKLPFNVRYFLPALPIFYLLLAKVLCKQKFTKYLICALLLTSYFQYYANKDYHREDYRGIANFAKQENLDTYLAPFHRNLHVYDYQNVELLRPESISPGKEQLLIINRPWAVNDYKKIMKLIKAQKYTQNTDYAGFEIYHTNPSEK
jgi:uncharacterized membrane protein